MDITTDLSDYSEFESDKEDIDTYADLLQMSHDEKDDIKYLSIFDNNYGQYDEQIITLDSMDELENMEYPMIDRTKT